jgi:hypothetical protein
MTKSNIQDGKDQGKVNDREKETKWERRQEIRREEGKDGARLCRRENEAEGGK